MRFCERMLLARTRRILLEIQEGIERAAKPRRVRNRRFEEWQLVVAREWHERVTASNNKSRS